LSLELVQTKVQVDHRGWKSPQENKTPVRLYPDGSFEAGPLPLESYTLRLSREARGMVHSSTGKSSYWRNLAEMDLEPGENELTLDVEEHVPGRFEIVSKTSSFLDWLVWGSGSEGGVAFMMSSPLDAHRYVSEALFPDAYTVELRKANGWVPAIATDVVVRPGGTARKVVEFETLRGRIQVVDLESGEPLRNHGLSLRVQGEGLEGAAGASSIFNTDEKGWLDLELGVGTYTFSVMVRGFSRPDARNVREVDVSWLRKELIPSRIEL